MMQEAEVLDLGSNKLRFEVIRGVIAGDKKWAETHVYSSGGSGYVGPQGGYVQLPTVNSDVRTRQEIWIREHENGREFPINLTDANVQVREGHEVAVVIADTGQHRYFVQLVNRTAQRAFPLLANFESFVVESAKLRPVGFLRAAVVPVLFAAFVGSAANISYQTSQQRIEESNFRIRAEAIHVPYDEYSRASENDRQSMHWSFLAKHRAKLLGVSIEESQRMGRSGEDRTILERKAKDLLGVPVPWHYFLNKSSPGRPKLTAEKENALEMLWYGHPDFDNHMSDYDKKYREHGTQIGWAVGLAVGLIGLLMAAHRFSRFSRRFNVAKNVIQTHLNRLIAALK